MTTGTIKINRLRVRTDRLFLRTSRNGFSHNGFRRKAVRHWNDAGNKWTGKPTCKTCGGFFGIDGEAYAHGLSSRPTLELCEWRGERVVIGGNKICVSSYRVVAVGEDISEVDAASALLHVCRVAIVRAGETVNQSNGYCYAYDGSTVYQSGGDCGAHAGSTVYQSGGDCGAHAGSTVYQSGGYCGAHAGSTVYQSGGYCDAHAGSTVYQSGGGCYAHDGSTVNQLGGRKGE